MLRSKTALGIDVSGGRINLALIRNHADSIELLKTASSPVPEGAVKDGNIENATILAKAIRNLKAKNRIHSQNTVFSLLAEPSLTQIIDIPKDARVNVRRFVHDEVKHYAALPVNETAMDFCGLKSSTRSSACRALVVATDARKILAAMKAMNSEGLNISAIEPAWVAYARACYAKLIATKQNTNLLFVMINGNNLTLSLFRNQSLEFVRTKSVEADQTNPLEYVEWLAEEIDAVMKYYEVHGHESKWHLTLLFNVCDKLLSEVTDSLKTRFTAVDLHIRTYKDAYLDTTVTKGNCENTPSAVAIGLAARLLGVPDSGLNINIFPSELTMAKSVENQTLAVANIAAVILVLIILSVGYFSGNINKVNAQIEKKRQIQINQNTPSLLDEQSLLQRQTTDLSEKIEAVDNVLSKKSAVKWGQMLADVSLATPKTVQITELFSNDNSKMVIEGLAFSYEDIYLFVDTLNTCRSIKSASLTGTERHSSQESFVEYSISCSLNK